mmetsp:Transcript_19162/g.41627  ORF Transcript_19162/g.41627 Transcript_19162/m.41627 type:complete len:183 (-) Transcript_19162:190-738(-)|eukprot:CAMPEP_0168191696 /NCGR_PEP_ID=MMETSP0139_2-20121125/17657_1 /TAXON_ID=44445 /ORGANISM="Pseudo-nitzschia australis, Strain 10249 10 AB" /LENGTH=182 /DNA_ID=CAMNT_0008114895 /DNA_START=313 /DNA_END=861 /DNA_ORIENTATION=-
MALRDYMQDLIRARNASEINIVHDNSMSMLPCKNGGDYYTSMETSDLDVSMSSLLLHDLKEGHLIDSDSSLHYFSGHFFADDSNSDEVLLDDVDVRTKGRVLDDSAHEVDLGLMLQGFRERHRRLKQTLSPVKVYQLSPTIIGSHSQTTPTKSQIKIDNQRSRLAKLATTSQIDGPPSLTDY